MPTNVMMPQMGESIVEGTIIKWLKKAGERVERDEPLFEITTDKVDAEIPSPAAGTLSKILAAENETVAVNTVVAIINGERPPEVASSAEAPDESLAESRRGSAGAPSSAAGANIQQAAPSGIASASHSEMRARSSPLVRRIASEHNVDLSFVKGSGLGGRISKKDILKYLERRESSRGMPAAAPTGAPERSSTGPESTLAPTGPRLAELAFIGPTYIVPMTPIRRQIAEHMVASKRTSAHVTTVFEVEMTRIVELRERLAKDFEQLEGLKLTYTPFFARSAVEAIKRFPVFNSSMEGTNLVYKREINLGIAVALETGLIVPVIKGAGDKNFREVARAVQDLAERARSKRLSVEEVQNGTFTLTNPGVFGSLFGTPIIHQPQVAILGVGVIEKRPVVRNDAVAIRALAYLALTFDHRVIDGAVADQFMAHLKNTLENWKEAVL